MIILYDSTILHLFYDKQKKKLLQKTRKLLFSCFFFLTKRCFQKTTFVSLRKKNKYKNVKKQNAPPYSSIATNNRSTYLSLMDSHTHTTTTTGVYTRSSYYYQSQHKSPADRAGSIGSKAGFPSTEVTHRHGYDTKSLLNRLKLSLWPSNTKLAFVSRRKNPQPTHSPDITIQNNSTLNDIEINISKYFMHV